MTWNTKHGHRLSSPILNEQQIEQIHDRSLAMLENMGMVMPHKKILKCLSESGAYVDHGKNIVRFPSAIVERALESAPSSFTVHGQNREDDMPLEPNGAMYGRCVGGSECIIDHPSQKRRFIKLKDTVNWARLADELDSIALVNTIYPDDVPLQTRDVECFAVLLENTSKPIVIAPYSGKSFQCMHEMASIVSGGTEELRLHPRFAVYISVRSPLLCSPPELEVLWGAAQAAVPVWANSSPITGATGPVTLAGSVLLMNVEILALLTTIQMINPGAPVLYTPKPEVFDMRTGISSIGHPEGGSLTAATVQMGKYYNLPTESWGLTSDSLVCDEQAALEKTFWGQWSYLVGTDIAAGAGLLDASRSISLPQLVIDNELFKFCLRSVQPINWNECTLAEEVIKRVGHGGTYLTDRHTLEYFKQECYYSDIFNHLPYEIWQQRGSKSVVDLAAEKVKSLLEKDRAAKLADHVLEEIRAIVRRVHAGS